MSVQKKIESSDLVLKTVDEQDIEAAVALIRDIGQYQHVIYHMAFRTNAPTDWPYLKSTYSFSWLGHYVQQNYAEIDPIWLRGFKEPRPFFWSQLRSEDPREAAFFDDAQKHGAGSVGFSIPISDRAQRKALFSVTSELSSPDWRKKIASEKATLERLGDMLHRKAVLDIYGTEEGPSLAPRELECLYWTAKGKDGPTVAEILHISEHTVRDYLKSARHKLGCHTIAQTIHEATKRRLINF